jgi:hypothetical protein
MRSAGCAEDAADLAKGATLRPAAHWHDGQIRVRVERRVKWVVIASDTEAIQSNEIRLWIASSPSLLAMTGAISAR